MVVHHHQYQISTILAVQEIKIMALQKWPPDGQGLWIMNYGHLVNKAHTASHLFVLIIAQQAAQMNQ